MSLFAGCLRRLTDTPTRNELKGYKVTDVNRTRKFGVACRSLQELKRKACSKLNLTNDLAEVNVFLLDGSLIDEEYFSTLEPQTTLIIQKPGEKVLTDADLLYDTLRRVNIDFLTAGVKASEFLTEHLKAKVAVLNNFLNKDDSKTSFSSRDDHPEWFRGLDTNCATKEAYMHRRCQDRIRSYLYKTIDQIKSSDEFTKDPRARKQLLYAIAFFKMQLKEDHYFGHYFDRTRAKLDSSLTIDERDSFTDCYDHCPCRLDLDGNTYYRLFGTINRSCVDGSKKKSTSNRKTDSRTEVDNEDDETCPYPLRGREIESCVAMCDRNGEFKCNGVWNMDKCFYGDRHRINPYRSREELILFSTWNFDHKIERSRTLIPLLLNLSSQKTANETDILDIYDNLFTSKNLRLVHIVCHDKGSHK